MPCLLFCFYFRALPSSYTFPAVFSLPVSVSLSTVVLFAILLFLSGIISLGRSAIILDAFIQEANLVPNKSGPPVWRFGVRLTTSHCKNKGVQKRHTLIPILLSWTHQLRVMRSQEGHTEVTTMEGMKKKKKLFWGN